MDEANPFASTETEVDAPYADLPTDEARERQLPFEKRVIRIASWSMFFGVWIALFGVGNSLMWVRRWSEAGAAGSLAIGLLVLSVGVAKIANGFVLRSYHPLAAKVSLGLWLLVVPLFPVGTWVGIRSMIELVRRGSRCVFSAEGAAIRAATPAMDPKRPSPVVPLAGPFVILAFCWVVYLAIRP